MQFSSLIFWPLIFLLGLCLGSFLNVVITRLPVMLMRQWRQEARAQLALEEETSPRFNLAQPRSMCPRCETALRWHDNLPLLGWLKRRGRCAHCDGRISVQYPLIELAGGVLAISVALLYASEWQALWLYAACLTLLTLAVIDWRVQLLPDILTLPLLWAGLLYHWLFQPAYLGDAVIGAVMGYLSLWSFYWLFKLATGKEGMGFGDFKLLAALGAWLGWLALPLVLLFSAGLGAILGLVYQASTPQARGTPMPFGPFLALAGWIMLLAGNDVLAVYLAIVS